jgi:hypothetical protein
MQVRFSEATTNIFIFTKHSSLKLLFTQKLWRTVGYESLLLSLWKKQFCSFHAAVVSFTLLYSDLFFGGCSNSDRLAAFQKRPDATL